MCTKKKIKNYDAHKKKLTSKICHMYLLNKIIFKFPEISRNAVENAWWSVKYQHVRLLGVVEVMRRGKQRTGGEFSCLYCTCRVEKTERQRQLCTKFHKQVGEISKKLRRIVRDGRQNRCKHTLYIRGADEKCIWFSVY